MLKEMVEQSKLNQVKQALEARHISTVILKDRQAVKNYLKDHIKKGMLVCRGGSVTLNELDLIDHLDEVSIVNHGLPYLTKEEKEICFQKGFQADLYLMSASAITQQGEIYNVDGKGNRLAALLYGPKQVYIIVGKNKIVYDLEEAKERMKKIAAPKNALRLQKKTPCVKTGKCEDCQSKDRICCDEVIIHYQTNENRIQVIIVEENLGY